MPHVSAALQALHKRVAEENCKVVVSAKVESELNGMPSEEAKEWLEMSTAPFRIHQQHTHTANFIWSAAPLLPFQALRKRAAEENCEVVVVSAKVESELNGMPSEEAKEWLEMLGVEPGEGGGLGALIRATYKTLGLQTYFTTGVFQSLP
jgi:ribosome-binding ATPase YchF (GTP1/OBG family)